MPASLYQSNLSMERIASTAGGGGGPTGGGGDLDAPAVKLAWELAMLGSMENAMDSLSLNGSGAATLAQLEEMKNNNRKSANMTECVPVPTSEHVAEIVGRQGCKIKALRAKTNTYIKTPVRGEEPVFVVTGRKEDVALAKREILSAADHFSQLRKERKHAINSTHAFGQMVGNIPGKTTIQVRVPYKVVGLVVGPKGATIKRIQQQTNTYIVTPSRDKEPIFEVSGLPEHVDAARKEIESHIAMRTGSLFDGPDSGDEQPGSGSSGGLGGINNFNSAFSSSGSSGLSSLLSESSGCSNSSSLLSKYHANNSTSNSILSNSHHHHQSANINIDDLHLHSLIESNNFDNKFNNAKNGRDIGSIGSTLWGCGDSHDSGIGHSPPYDSSHSLSGLAGANSGGGGIWNELGKVLGGLDSPPTEASPPLLVNPIITKPSTPRSASIDLGIPLSNPSSINNGCLISGDSHHHQQKSIMSSDGHHNHHHNAAVSQTTSLPFTLNGLTTTLATLSASLTTLNENGAMDSSDLLSSLRRSSPDQDLLLTSLRRTASPDNNTLPAFSTDAKSSLGAHTPDFLSFTNH